LEHETNKENSLPAAFGHLVGEPIRIYKKRTPAQTGVDSALPANGSSISIRTRKRTLVGNLVFLLFRVYIPDCATVFVAESCIPLVVCSIPDDVDCIGKSGRFTLWNIADGHSAEYAGSGSGYFDCKKTELNQLNKF